MRVCENRKRFHLGAGGLAVRFDSFARTNTTRKNRYTVAADQIVDSSSTNNNSNNDREVDGDFKRVNEVLESSKACVFQPNLFCR